MDGLASLPVAALLVWWYQRARAEHPVWAPRVLAATVVAAVGWVGIALLRPAPATNLRVWVERAAVDDVFPIGDRHVVRLAVAEPAICMDGDARGVQLLLDPGVDASGLAPGARIDALVRVAPWGCGLVRFGARR